MNILCVSDGSDDGYQAAELVARIIDPRVVDRIRILMVTWPQRRSPLWKKAYELWAAEDDLHQAMEVTVQRELDRFSRSFRDHAGAIETARTSGQPVSQVLKSAKDFGADLILVAITGDAQAHGVRRTSSEIVAKSPVPVVIAYGGNDATSARRRSAPKRKGLKRVPVH